MNTSSPTPTSLSGMLLAAVAFALLTSVDTIFKLVALGQHPAHQILFANACFALAPIIIWSMLTGGVARLRTSRPLPHLVRGATSVLSAYAAIYAYSRLPLTNFYAFIFMGPLLVTALSALWLHETIDRARWGAVITGLIGIMIVTHFFGLTSFLGLPPTNHLEESAAGGAAAILSVFCYSLSVITIRRMRSGETNMTFSFYGYLASMTIGGGLYLVLGAPPLLPHDIGHLALSGTLAGIASICLMTAYHRTPIALVAPFQYTQIIWGAVAGYVIWNHVPDIYLVIGSGIVAASGFFILLREIRGNNQ